jgi:CheY-like chemotaxis protein
VRLPRQDQAPAEPQIVKQAGARPTAGGSHRVLVVDDNVDAAESMRRFLQARGQDVRCAFDGSSALGLAREFKPQLVLLDVAMPEMDGYEVLRRLREQSGTDQPVIAVLTGYGANVETERLKQLGLDHYLVKPVTLPALQALIASLG